MRFDDLGIEIPAEQLGSFAVSQNSTLTPTLKFDAKTIGTDCAVSSIFCVAAENGQSCR